MRKKWKRPVFLMIIMVLLFGTMAVPTEAAARKLRNQAFTRVRAKADAKAYAVNTGTTTVKIPSKGRGYLKFTAPVTEEYAFTVYGLKSKAQLTEVLTKKGTIKKKKVRPFSNGYFYVMAASQANAERIGQASLQTSGGITNTLWVATKKVQYGNKVGWRLKKRTGIISLEKGQTVYLYFNFNKGDSVKLRIESGI